jgi:hypothetical protein
MSSSGSQHLNSCSVLRQPSTPRYENKNPTSNPPRACARILPFCLTSLKSPSKPPLAAEFRPLENKLAGSTLPASSVHAARKARPDTARIPSAHRKPIVRAFVRASFKSLYLKRPADQLEAQPLLVGAPDTALRLRGRVTHRSCRRFILKSATQ